MGSRRTKEDPHEKEMQGPRDRVSKEASDLQGLWGRWDPADSIRVIVWTMHSGKEDQMNRQPFNVTVVTVEPKRKFLVWGYSDTNAVLRFRIAGKKLGFDFEHFTFGIKVEPNTEAVMDTDEIKEIA